MQHTNSKIITEVSGYVKKSGDTLENIMQRETSFKMGSFSKYILIGIIVIISIFTMAYIYNMISKSNCFCFGRGGAAKGGAAKDGAAKDKKTTGNMVETVKEKIVSLFK
jgi:hypothetical protein